MATRLATFLPTRRNRSDEQARRGRLNGAVGSGLGLRRERTPGRADPLLRPPEVARLLACSTKTVYAWAAKRLPPFRSPRTAGPLQTWGCAAIRRSSRRQPPDPLGVGRNRSLRSADVGSQVSARRVDEKLTEWRDALPLVRPGLNRETLHVAMAARAWPRPGASSDAEEVRGSNPLAPTTGDLLTGLSHGRSRLHRRLRARKSTRVAATRV
jgi:predicted DNA-binding transcriptional regulator AlpA